MASEIQSVFFCWKCSTWWVFSALYLAVPGLNASVYIQGKILKSCKWDWMRWVGCGANNKNNNKGWKIKLESWNWMKPPFPPLGPTAYHGQLDCHSFQQFPAKHRRDSMQKYKKMPKCLTLNYCFPTDFYWNFAQSCLGKKLRKMGK